MLGAEGPGLPEDSREIGAGVLGVENDPPVAPDVSHQQRYRLRLDCGPDKVDDLPAQFCAGHHSHQSMSGSHQSLLKVDLLTEQIAINDSTKCRVDGNR